ncbi:hypothetical protein CP061683_1254B, partial [Chlamydia psittaci 06-1683]
IHKEPHHRDSYESLENLEGSH